MEIQPIQILGFIVFIIGVILVVVDAVLKIRKEPRINQDLQNPSNKWDVLIEFLKMVLSVMRKLGPLGKAGMIIILLGVFMMILPSLGVLIADSATPTAPIPAETASP